MKTFASASPNLSFSIFHLLFSTLAILASTAVALSQSADYTAGKAIAEKYYTEGSYARAHEVYAKMEVSSLSAEDARWVAFRLADTQWRSAAASANPDSSELDSAHDSLEKQIRDLTRDDQHDRIWAEVEESIGDFYWRGANYNWSMAWPCYEMALDWWAGQSDLDLARGRYLNIVWKMADPPAHWGSNFVYGDWGCNIPMDVLENAAKIAQTDDDKAHAHYLIAMTLRGQGGDWVQMARVPREFEEAIRAGKKTDWYGDALINYAQWLEQNGRAIMDKDGNWSSHPDYVRALALYRQFTGTFSEGESRFWGQATNEIENITGSQVRVSVDNIFLPDSEVQYSLYSRNSKKIQMALYPVDLNQAVNFPASFGTQPDWLQTIDLGQLKSLKKWTREVEDQGDYAPTNAMVRLDRKLKPGAYILEAQGGGQKSRDLVLVTDAALVLKTSDRQALVYFCDAVNSAPIANAPVKLWMVWNDDQGNDSRWHSRSYDGITDSNGITVIPFDRKMNTSMNFYATARSGDRQAFANANNYGYGDDSAGWRIYAFTDRPAYRPKETVNWKFIARRSNGSVYLTPSGRTIEYEIWDPRGTKVKSDKIKLNEFGSAWASLDLTERMPLGEYRVQFWNQGHHREIGNATLFRLEEYKLPEFKVTVQTPEENGKKETFRLGDTVEATIQADYYFGGSVAGADVNVVVRQKPFSHLWHKPREYSWFYGDIDRDSPDYGWHGGEQTITNAVLKTDATGKATLTFATPQNAGNDFEYDIEARVTDVSRREITGNGTVRVTHQSYYVQAEPSHNLCLPHDKVTVNFKALDANDQPVQAEGDVKVTRDYWYEIWRAPDGHEVKGDELKKLQAKYKIWPPPPERPDQKNWELKFRGYEHDDVLTRHLTTDTNGDGELSFKPERKGYYHIMWMGRDAPANHLPQPINADTTIWVVNNRTTELGYRTGGVEIIADKDTFHAGGTAPVMLVTPEADRYVLLTAEGQGIYHYQLVHLDGTVKLVNLAIDESFVPNVFLDATLVNDRQIFTDEKQIVVPPVKNFLNVDVKADRSDYEPRDQGTLTVTTRNDQGKPVSAEVALSLADESVFYIQDDYAGDPRQFFFGTKRSQQIQTQSTMNQKSYEKLVKWKGQLIDEQEKERMEEQSRIGISFGSMGEGGGGGGGAGGPNNPFVTRFSQKVVGYANVAMGGSGGGLLYVTTPQVADSINVYAPPAMPATGIPVMGSLLKSVNYRLGDEPSPSEQSGVVVRSDFRSTIFWQPDVMTDKNGEAKVKVTYPDSVTSWRATARAVTAANQFGIAQTTTRTRQPLIVRFEGPRFFVVGDTVTISAVVNNNTDKSFNAKVSLYASGLDVAQPSETPTIVNVPANGEARADWTATVESPGAVKLKVTARSDQYADAMENTFTAYEHGIEKFLSKSGKTRSDVTTVELVLPHERKADSTSLTVQVTPSMAVTMLDALPYLINYPYGCTEQTMSRFLPTVVTTKTLRDLGLKPEDIMGRVFGGIETNTAAATHSDQQSRAHEQAMSQINQMTQASLDRLYGFQHGDGGWGWWKDDDSDHWMTAYVVWGLALARDAGVQFRSGVLQRGVKFLDVHLVDEKENYDMQAFMLHALASCHPRKISKFQRAAFDNLWQNRDQLNAYTRALLALSAHEYQFDDRAKILADNLENGVIRDDHPDQSILTGPAGASSPTVMATAHWGNDGVFWHWSDNGVEATAFALRALMAIDPTNALVEPVANWLIKNRRGAQWNNTRDTAIAVLALNDYLRASGELQSDTTFQVFVNGTQVAERHVNGADVFNAPSRFAIDSKLIADTNEIRIVRVSGKGPLYFSADAGFFSTEEPITPAGNEIFVKRQYFKLVPRQTLLKGYVDDREPLLDGGTVTSGERIETVLSIEAKNDYDYLMFEDLKPAGFETVEVRSGESLDARELKSAAVARKFSGTNEMYMVQSGDTLGGIARRHGISVRAIREANNLTLSRIKISQKLVIPMVPAPQEDSDYTGRTCGVYQELRDRQVALFLDHLPQGIWEIRYDVRAETPGQFHALPVTGGAMYVPEVRCNSAEVRVNVEDKGPM
jgi:hypothetical protein